MVNTNTSSGTRVRQCLCDCLDVGCVERRRGHELCERVAARLRVVRRARERVEHHARLVLLRERRAILDAHERVADHHLTHRLVRQTRATEVPGHVRIVCRGLERTQEVAGVDDDARAADLAETEGRLRI